MANINKYPLKDFSTSQKFLAGDNTGTTVRVAGQSILEAALSSLLVSGVVVQSIDTLTQAIATNYNSGDYVLTGGGTITLDGDQAIYRVSDAGNGGIVMANGNELMLLFVANTPANIVTPIASVANLFGLTGVALQQISVGEYNASSNVGNFGAKWRADLARTVHDGVRYHSPSRDLTTEGLTAYLVASTDAALGVWENTEQTLNPEMCGAIGDGVTNDTSASTVFFNVDHSAKLANRLYLTVGALQATIANQNIYGVGSFINNGTGTNAFEIVGDGNDISGLIFRSTANQQAQDAVLVITGDNNKVLRCSTKWDTFLNPTIEGQQYGSIGIKINGNYNKIQLCDTENTNTGILDFGIGNAIEANKIINTCAGVNLTNRSRNAVVNNNYIDCEYGGQTLQGCDGIWGNRNHRYSVITNNTILNAGEHGTYLQGDSYRVANNYVANCYGDGIKAGGKITDAFWYPGETVRLLAASGDYTGFDAVITGNTCENNRTGGLTTGAEIYLQPNCLDFIVSNNTCRFGNAHGIRSVFFELSADEVMAGITVTNNKVHSCVSDSINIAASDAAKIHNNECDGLILTYARDAAAPMTRGEVMNNTCLGISSARSLDLVVSGNTAEYFTISNESALLTYNIFTAQQQGAFAGRIRKMTGNIFTYIGNVSASYEECDDVTDNEFNFPDATSAYALAVDFNSDTPQNGKFSGNTVSCPLATRCAQIGGIDSTINGNTFINDGTDDYIVSIYSNDCVISANAVTNGSLRLETGSGSNIVNGNAAKVSDVGTANLSTANRP